jgi:hypothetical protein
MLSFFELSIPDAIAVGWCEIPLGLVEWMGCAAEFL